jgi:hypothetical protein
MYELSFSALSLARRVSRCELKLVSCMLVLMFAGGLGDLYTEDSMYVLLCTLASMVIVSIHSNRSSSWGSSPASKTP